MGQAQRGESLVGIANGASPTVAILQFQGGGNHVRYTPRTRLYHYDCAAKASAETEREPGAGAKIVPTVAAP